MNSYYWAYTFTMVEGLCSASCMELLVK